MEVDVVPAGQGPAPVEDHRVEVHASQSRVWSRERARRLRRRLGQPGDPPGRLGAPHAALPRPGGPAPTRGGAAPLACVATSPSRPAPRGLRRRPVHGAAPLPSRRAVSRDVGGAGRRPWAPSCAPCTTSTRRMLSAAAPSMPRRRVESRLETLEQMSREVLPRLPSHLQPAGAALLERVSTAPLGRTAGARRPRSGPHPGRRRGGHRDHRLGRLLRLRPGHRPRLDRATAPLPPSRDAVVAAYRPDGDAAGPRAATSTSSAPGTRCSTASARAATASSSPASPASSGASRCHADLAEVAR